MMKKESKEVKDVGLVSSFHRLAEHLRRIGWVGWDEVGWVSIVSFFKFCGRAWCIFLFPLSLSLFPIASMCTHTFLFFFPASKSPWLFSFFFFTRSLRYIFIIKSVPTPHTSHTRIGVSLFSLSPFPPKTTL